MKLDLEGKRCLVTGASAGIGRGIARVLAAEGARLALAGRDEGRLAEARDEALEKGAAGAEIVAADLTTADGVDRLAAEAADRLGGVEVLVNNAGGSRPLSGTADQSVWDEAVALNFTAPRRLAEGCASAMQAAGWGRIINVTGIVAPKSVNAACAAKAALLSWVRGITGELAPAGVTVNCVSPGRIESEQVRTRLHPTEESRRAFIEANIPMGRFGEPEDIGHVVAFLASPLAGYITGVTVPVDGGMYRLALT